MRLRANKIKPPFGFTSVISNRLLASFTRANARGAFH